MIEQAKETQCNNARHLFNAHSLSVMFWSTVKTRYLKQPRITSKLCVIESTIFSVWPGWALHVTSMMIVFQKAGTVCGLTTETRNTKMCVHKTLYSCIFGLPVTTEIIRPHETF